MPNLKNSCRICMKVVKKDETHSIFTIKIKEMLNCCTTIQFENNDNFPSNLCNNCLKQLKIAFEFRKKAEESNENFQKLIEDNFNSNQDYTDESDEFNCSENFDNNDKSHIWKRGEESNDRLVKIEENDDFNCNVNKEDISESNEDFKILLKDEFNYEHDILKKGEQDYENLEKLIKDDFNCDVNIENDISESNEHFKVLIKDEFNYDYDISDDKTYISREAEETNETKKLINNDETYVCEQCNQKFPSKFLLILHIKLFHSNKPERTSCDFCDKQYKHFKNFKLHLMKKHFKVKPHSCHLCQKSFSYPHDLRNHEKSHSDLKPFKCPQCEKSFIEEFQLKQHQLNFHKSRRWFECTDCGLRFNTNGSLKSHLRIHTTLKSSHHKVTEQDSTLQEHKKPRTDEQNCICSICGISTTTIPILKRHLWTHTEKPYRCNVPHCGKAYTRNEHLKRHTQITHS